MTVTACPLSSSLALCPWPCTYCYFVPPPTPELELHRAMPLSLPQPKLDAMECAFAEG